jgi:hypothetical protein
MQPARLMFDDAPAFIPVPAELQHHRIEVILWPLDTPAISAPTRRQPPAALKGKVRETGDVMQSLNDADWGCR